MPGINNNMELITLHNYIWAAAFVGFAANVVLGILPLFYAILSRRNRPFWSGVGLSGLMNAVLILYLATLVSR